MTRARALLWALPLAVLTACGGGGIPPAQNYATIQGRVFDASTRQPIPGVQLSVFTIIQATTGSDGSYKFTNVPVGSYGPIQVTSVPPGYRVPSSFPGQTGSTTSGETITVDIPLTRG